MQGCACCVLFPSTVAQPVEGEPVNCHSVVQKSLVKNVEGKFDNVTYISGFLRGGRERRLVNIYRGTPLLFRILIFNLQSLKDQYLWRRRNMSSRGLLRVEVRWMEFRWSERTLNFIKLRVYSISQNDIALTPVQGRMRTPLKDLSFPNPARFHLRRASYCLPLWLPVQAKSGSLVRVSTWYWSSVLYFFFLCHQGVDARPNSVNGALHSVVRGKNKKT